MNMEHQPEESDSPEHGSTVGFLAIAGVLEIVFLVIAVIIIGVAYTVGLHLAILVLATAIAGFGFWKWKANRL